MKIGKVEEKSMGMNNSLIDMILEYLKQQKILTDLEKDIISTVDKYREIPFDRKSAEQKIIENNNHHMDIFTAISLQPGIEVKPFSKVNDEDIKHNLYMQIEAMCIKEQATLKN